MRAILWRPGLVGRHETHRLREHATSTACGTRECRLKTSGIRNNAPSKISARTQPMLDLFRTDKPVGSMGPMDVVECLGRTKISRIPD